MAQARTLVASPLPLSDAVRARAREAVAEDEGQRAEPVAVEMGARRFDEVEPARARDLAQPDRRERVQSTRQTLRALCEEAGGLLQEAALLGDEETPGSPLDPLQDARGSIAHDVRELELTRARSSGPEAFRFFRLSCV